MASLSFLVSSSRPVTHSLPFTFTSRASPSSPLFPNSLAVRFAGYPCRRKVRGLTVVTRAGPSTSSYIFAFALPLSLLAVTIFTSIRIADKLEADFLEEMAMNEAIMEADGEDDDYETDDDGDEDDDPETILQEPEPEPEPEPETLLEKEPEPALPRTRNRPKREA